LCLEAKALHAFAAKPMRPEEAKLTRPKPLREWFKG
jgi:hypothetical protein